MQGYFRTKFIPTEVGVMKFRTTHMRSKDSENIGTSGSRMSFEACERSNLQNSVTFAGMGIAGLVPLKHCNSLIFCFLDET